MGTPARVSLLTVATLSIAAAAAGLLGCAGPGAEIETMVAGGDVDRGRAALDGFGCGACHLIPGIPGARGLVGPPLTMFARRAYIAGQLPNQPDNLIRWIQDPQSVEQGTAMPNLGVNPVTARDMAAYLYTLR
ncbi:MAG: c-type cytochrome [Gemmatimonadales bacterium]